MNWRDFIENERLEQIDLWALVMVIISLLAVWVWCR